MARYLLAASPIAGHVIPMLRIATDLQRRGHTVRLITGPQYHSAITRAGVRAVTLPAAAQPRPTSGSTNSVLSPSLLGLWRAGRAEMRSVFVDPLIAQYQTLRDELDRERADAVMVDVAFTGAVPLLLSDKARPPVAVCGVGPLMLSSIDTPAFGVGWQPQPGIDYADMNWFVHHILFADIQAGLNSALRSVDARRSPVFLTDWPTLADLVLQPTVPATEYVRRDLTSKVVFTGPIIDDPDAEVSEPPAWWPELQRTSRTVVHVTQGTWDNRDPGQLIRPTLEALSGRDDLLVIATTGSAEKYPGAIPANAVVTDYVPYAALLPHVDVMITNGGYGGVQHALLHGIPLIVAGRTADKPEVAARVAYTGAGINLKTARPTRQAIAQALDQLLSTGTYRLAAQSVGRDMAETDALSTIADVLADMHAPYLEHPLASGA